MFLQMDQLLNMLSGRATRIQQPDKSINLDAGLVDQKTLFAYPSHIKEAYFHLFNSDSKLINLFNVFPFEKKKTKTPVCNKILEPYEYVYRCYDCSDHEGAILCNKCFEAGHHTGHRFTKIHSGGGNCDCGNPLAIKEMGFCRDHTGIPEIPEVSEKQLKQFHFAVSHLFFWLSQLKKIKKESYLKLGKIITNYLIALNNQSLYYNVLTDYLLQNPFNPQQPELLIEWLFKVKEDFIIKSLCDLYFKMFSFDKFKYHLAISFVKAYNCDAKFKDTGFHCLFIQLFANDWLLLDVCKNTKLVINPKKGHNSLKFLEDFNFICSVKDEAAIQFYRTYFTQNLAIPFDGLDKIEDDIQKNPQMQGGQLVDMVMNYINEENLFYYTYENTFAKMHKDEELLTRLVRGLFQYLHKNHSYIKNKAILPYQRIISLGLFCLCKGEIETLSIQFLMEKLQFQHQFLLNFIKINYKRVLWCLHEFAQTFIKRNYFDNYLALYIRSGRTCSNHDYTFIRQMAIILMKEGISTEEILLEIVQQKMKEVNVSENNSYSVTQLVQSFTSLIGILTQVVISPIQCFIHAKDMEIQIKKKNDQKKQFFKELLRQLGSMTRDQIKNVEKYFTGQLDDEFLFETCDFDKVHKKYSAKGSGPSIWMAYFPSRLKVSNNFSKRQLDRSVSNMKSSKNQTSIFQDKEDLQKLLPTIIPSGFVLKIISIISSNFGEITQKQIGKTLKEEVTKLIYIRQQKQYTKLLDLLDDIYTQNGKENEEQSEEAKKLRKKQLEAKKAQKMKKFKQKQNNFLQKIQKNISCQTQDQTKKIKEKHQEQADSLCIICHNDDEQDVLCYLANYRESNVMYRKLGDPNQRSPIFNSCEHTAHFKCCQKAFGNKSVFKCPLCKFSCNVMLPVPGSSNAESCLQMMTRIQVIFSTYKNKVNEDKTTLKSEGEVLFYMFKSLIEQIGIIGLIDENFYNKKYRKINDIIYDMLVIIWNSIPEKEQQIFSTRVKNEKIEMQTIIQKSMNEGQNQTITNKKCKTEKEIMKAIKQCIMEQILHSLSLKQKKLETQKIFDSYSSRINYEDLTRLIDKILWVVEKQDQEKRYEVGAHFNDQLPKVKDLFSFFSPPETIRHLIQIRDGQTYPKCKNGHNVCICCECKEAFCEDCKTLSKHSTQIHANHSIAFSLLNGQLICDLGFAKIKVPSLYENKIGAKWSPEKPLDGYLLESELYEEMIKNLALLSIDYYMQLKRPDLIEYRAGLNIEFA